MGRPSGRYTGPRRVARTGWLAVGVTGTNRAKNGRRSDEPMRLAIGGLEV